MSSTITNGTTATTPVATPTHVLGDGFTLWHLNKNILKDENNNDISYEDAMVKLGTFKTLESFWGLYSYIKRPNDLKTSMELNCFREGVAPLWEDIANRDGGKWVIRLKKGMANRCWENALLALLGDQFHLGDEICGIVVSTKYSEDTLSFWNKTANDKQVILKIRDSIKRILQIQSNTALEYKPHNAAIKQIHDNSSPLLTGANNSNAYDSNEWALGDGYRRRGRMNST